MTSTYQADSDAKRIADTRALLACDSYDAYLTLFRQWDLRGTVAILDANPDENIYPFAMGAANSMMRSLLAIIDRQATEITGLREAAYGNAGAETEPTDEDRIHRLAPDGYPLTSGYEGGTAGKWANYA